MTQQPLVLVVDDEADFREIFSAKLSAAGFRVETADGGAMGIIKTKELQPDLVLMDVKMPDMDGAMAALKIQGDPATKDRKVAFLTSLGDPRVDMKEVDEKFSEDFGSKGYLKKTDDLNVVVQKIKAILGDEHGAGSGSE